MMLTVDREIYPRGEIPNFYPQDLSHRSSNFKLPPTRRLENKPPRAVGDGIDVDDTKATNGGWEEGDERRKK